MEEEWGFIEHSGRAHPSQFPWGLRPVAVGKVGITDLAPSQLFLGVTLKVFFCGEQCGLGMPFGGPSGGGFPGDADRPFSPTVRRNLGVRYFVIYSTPRRNEAFALL
jgi:hypothetical protein